MLLVFEYTAITTFLSMDKYNKFSS